MYLHVPAIIAILTQFHFLEQHLLQVSATYFAKGNLATRAFSDHYTSQTTKSFLNILQVHTYSKMKDMASFQTYSWKSPDGYKLGVMEVTCQFTRITQELDRRTYSKLNADKLPKICTSLLHKTGASTATFQSSESKILVSHFCQTCGPQDQDAQKLDSFKTECRSVQRFAQNRCISNSKIASLKYWYPNLARHVGPRTKTEKSWHNILVSFSAITYVVIECLPCDWLNHGKEGGSTGLSQSFEVGSVIAGVGGCLCHLFLKKKKNNPAELPAEIKK